MLYYDQLRCYACEVDGDISETILACMNLAAKPINDLITTQICYSIIRMQNKLVVHFVYGNIYALNPQFTLQMA